MPSAGELCAGPPHHQSSWRIRAVPGSELEQEAGQEEKDGATSDAKLVEEALSRRAMSHAHAHLHSSVSDLDSLQCRLGNIMESGLFHGLLSAVIFANLLLIVHEANLNASGEPLPLWLSVGNKVFLGIYMAELILRGYVLRAKSFADRWFIIDSAVVFADIFGLLVALVRNDSSSLTFSVIRILKLVRLFRTFKMLSVFPEVEVFLRGFMSSLQAIIWGTFLLVVIVTMWAILATNFLHPINKEVAESTDLYEGCVRCPHAFESVQASIWTIFQTTVAGDSWGTLALPIIERNAWAALFFLGVYMTIGLLTLNLILAVIVDAALSQKEANIQQLVVEKEHQVKASLQKFLGVCKALDTDSSGCLSKEEIEEGFFKNPDFHSIMDAIGLSPGEVSVVFNAMDDDCSGDVKYTELVDYIQKMLKPGMQQLVLEMSRARVKIQEHYHYHKAVLGEGGPRRHSVRGGDRAASKACDGQPAEQRLADCPELAQFADCPEEDSPSAEVDPALRRSITRETGAAMEERLEELTGKLNQLLEASRDATTVVLDLGQRSETQSYVQEAHGKMLADVGAALTAMLESSRGVVAEEALRATAATAPGQACCWGGGGAARPAPLVPFSAPGLPATGGHPRSAQKELPGRR